MNFKDLADKTIEDRTAEVEIGGETWTVRGLTDPTVILGIQEEAKARARLPITIDEVPVQLNESEINYYLFLAKGLVSEEPIEYSDVVAVSRKTGLDCLQAGLKVMELSGLIPEDLLNEDNSIAVEAKNA